MFIYNLDERYEWQNFIEAVLLIDFISKNKFKFVNQKIKGVFTSTSGFFSSDKVCMADTPAILLIGDYEIVINYMFYSDIKIMISPLIDSIVDYEKEYKICNLLKCKYWLQPKELEIEDIEITRFNDEFCINPADDETRPQGGDYFSVIALKLKDGKRLCICAEDGSSDGYMDIWVTNEGYPIKPLR